MEQHVQKQGGKRESEFLELQAVLGDSSSGEPRECPNYLTNWHITKIPVTAWRRMAREGVRWGNTKAGVPNPQAADRYQAATS